MEFIFNKKEAKIFFERFADELFKKFYLGEKNIIIIFQGELGAGKTQIIKWIAKKIGIKHIIQSPTFVIWKCYPFNLKTKNEKQKTTTKNLKFNKTFFLNHIDLYRLQNPSNIFKIGLRERMKEPNNLFLIEWGERINKFVKKPFIKIKIEIENKNKRKITISNVKC